jgi:arrestin-related trafficking adapter 3/6
MSHKNSLAIRLTESVVFLRNIESTGRRPNHDNDPTPTSLLRGLLVLDLYKPTRISSIDLSLIGKVVTSWPEGAFFFYLSRVH